MQYLRQNRRDVVTPRAKAKERTKINKQIKEYIKTGGKITKLKAGW